MPVLELYIKLSQRAGALVSRFLYSALRLWAFFLLRIVLVCLSALLRHIPGREHTTADLFPLLLGVPVASGR